MMGLLDYQGSAKIDGLEFKNLDEENRNLLLTLAPQNDYLFASSIRENLRVGDPKASDEKIEKVLALVELEKLIYSLPAGLDTHIGARGLNFSGGEQRRLLLARALLRRTPFVILDEPFEFLDMEQIERIAPRIFEYLKDAGVLIISHLPIPEATKVVALSTTPSR
jgi:ABC-type transport system involved in cytochrome bd biosynthesis fused ATPase/permease subunit